VAATILLVDLFSDRHANMKQSYIFAFGSNVHNKTVPFDSKVSVFLPVDVLPALAKVLPGDEAASGSWEVVWSGWAETLVRSGLNDVRWC
jgi:hypothetical protein